MALGHESAGEIVQLGANLAKKAADAESQSNGSTGAQAHVFRVGDRVTLEPGTTCRMCSDCRTGNYQICEHMEFAAYPPHDGTLQRYYKL